MMQRTIWGLIVFAFLTSGCHRRSTQAITQPAGPVVLYTSVDEPYVRPLADRFSKETGIPVQLLTDAEASKSVGLSEKLLAERDHPMADVWWDNEVFLTIRLADAGVLAVYDSPSAADIPAIYRDSGHRWAGSALRVRVFVSAKKLGDSRPRKWSDLLKPDLRGKIAMARPTAGTTGGQIAALFTVWGSKPAEDFFAGMHNNGVSMLGGNSVAAESVARGEMLVGLCDNDDAASVSTDIGPVDVTLPEQGPGETGTLAMPCAVALVDKCPHPDAGKRLIDFILSQQTDQALIDAKFAWCSARHAEDHGKFMSVDYAKVAAEMPAAIRQATAILEGR